MKLKTCSILLTIGMASLALPAHAIVPDAGNIYYGLARDFLGVPLAPGSGTEVVMARMDGGEEIVVARSPIISVPTADGEINYILRPSLDDGFAARYSPSAARSGDFVFIYVEQNGLRYPISSGPGCIPISDPVPAVESRSSVHRVDFRYIDDDDGDCISDSWERHYYGTTDFDGTEDFDEDGRTALEEFIDATNPLFPEPDPSTLPFPIVLSGSLGDIMTVDWDADPSRKYTILWSQDMQTFTAVPAEKLLGADGKQVDVSGMKSIFIRVKGERRQP